jgi:hypothetical protein
MKPISEKSLDAFEDVALAGAQQIKAYFAYKGESSTYGEKARVGAATIGAYARMRASETNRIAVEMAARRALGMNEARLEDAADRKKLTA